jgi:Flp pilus assembly protein TadB
MSLTSPPGHGKRLTQLLAFIVDDDERTRRANLLLRTVSTCLLIAGAIVAMVTPLAVGAGRYTVAAGGVVVLLLRTARARRQRSGR